MITALFSVMLLASDAAATVPAPEPSAAIEASKDEKKICKREMASKSRLAAKRVCLTAAEWRARSGGVKGLGDVSK